MVISMLKELSKNFNKEKPSIKKEIETLKRYLSEMYNTISEMEDTLETVGWMKERIKSTV